MAKAISVTSAVAADLLKHLPASRIRYGGADERRALEWCRETGTGADRATPLPGRGSGRGAAPREATICRCRYGPVAMIGPGGRSETAGWSSTSPKCAGWW